MSPHEANFSGLGAHGFSRNHCLHCLHFGFDDMRLPEMLELPFLRGLSCRLWFDHMVTVVAMVSMMAIMAMVAMVAMVVMEIAAQILDAAL